MIARIDCVSQWQKVLFQPHDIYPEFAAKAQLSWSKNVQIVLGSKNPVHYVFISLAIWLELYLTTQQQNLSPYVFDFSGDFTVPRGGDKTNDLLQTPYRTKYTIVTNSLQTEMALLEAAAIESGQQPEQGLVGLSEMKETTVVAGRGIVMFLIAMMVIYFIQMPKLQSFFVLEVLY